MSPKALSFCVFHFGLQFWLISSIRSIYGFALRSNLNGPYSSCTPSVYFLVSVISVYPVPLVVFLVLSEENVDSIFVEVTWLTSRRLFIPSHASKSLANATSSVFVTRFKNAASARRRSNRGVSNSEPLLEAGIEEDMISCQNLVGIGMTWWR